MGFKITVELVVRWRQGGTETTTRPLYFFNPKIGQNVVLSKNCGMKPRKEEFTFLGSPRCPPPTSPPVGLPWKVGGGLPLTWQVGGGGCGSTFLRLAIFPSSWLGIGIIKRSPLLNVVHNCFGKTPVLQSSWAATKTKAKTTAAAGSHNTGGDFTHFLD